MDFFDPAHRLLLVRRRNVVGSYAGFLATEAAPVIGMYFSPGPMDAWLATSPPRRAFCDTLDVGPTFRSCLDGRLRACDRHGRAIDRSPEERVIDMAENCCDLHLDPPPDGLELPAFVTTRPEARTVRAAMRVRLLVDRVADLPDLQAALDSVEEMTGSGTEYLADITGIRLPKRPHRSGEDWDAACRLPIRADMHLPTVLQADGGEVAGVLRLESDPRDRTCVTTFFAPSGLPIIRPGMRLVRRVHWRVAPDGIPADVVTEATIAVIQERGSAPHLTSS